MGDISSLACLNESQKRALARAGVTKLGDIWLQAPSDLAKKLRLTVNETQAMIDKICAESSPRPQYSKLGKAATAVARTCTTGDAALDRALGGGIHASSVTEISGESASGKTQLALQLAIMAQLPVKNGGLDGATAYFAARGTIQTTRLFQIATNHPKTGATKNLSTFSDNVHSCTTPAVPALLKALSDTLPSLIRMLKAQQRKPIRMVIIDSLGALFQSASKSTTSTLVDRSKSIAEISTLLHSLASTHGMAVVVLNQVTDVFQHTTYNSIDYRTPASSQDVVTDGDAELLYRDQVQWFNRGPYVYGDAQKEAMLGLTWANQLNTRIMLSKTRRRKRLDGSEGPPLKRRRLDAEKEVVPTLLSGYDDSLEEDESSRGTLLRRLSLVFDTTRTPTTLDYIITAAGLEIVSDPDADQDTHQPLRLTQLTQSYRPSQSTQVPTLPGTQGFTTAKQSQPFLSQQSTSAHPPATTTAVAQPQIKKEESFSSLNDFDEEAWASIDDTWDVPELEAGDQSGTISANLSLDMEDEPPLNKERNERDDDFELSSLADGFEAELDAFEASQLSQQTIVARS